MLKRLSLAFAGFFALATSALASGTIPLSMTQQFDSLGKPLTGGLLYFIQAGTTSTPQNAYQDSALTIPLPNPVTLDASARVPQLFFANGTIKVRLTDKNGVTQIVADNIQVVGASSGSGGGGTVDATTVLATGDLKVRYGTGSLSGFVRANGRTIGSATSGATERANSDCQALFEYLWGADSNLTVSGGRGASANADWTANKTIALPDWSGKAIGGLDDMGAGARGVLTSTYFGTDPTVLGAARIAQSMTLAKANLPNTTFSFAGTPATITVNSPSANVFQGSVTGSYTVGNGSLGPFPIMAAGSVANFLFSSGSYTPDGTVSSGGSGTAFSSVGPMKLATVYLKL